MTKARPSPLAVSIYNPANLKKKDLIRGFVGRQPLVDRLLDDLKREGPGTAPQHQLIIAQYGFGKTTLLRRVAFAVEDDSALNAIWMPLVFREEQYNVASLGDFWVNCAAALSTALDSSGEHPASRSLEARIKKVPFARADRSAVALQLLMEEADRLQRRFVLLVDNLEILLDRLDPEEEWEFRRVISQEGRLHFIGASSRVLEAFYEHGRAFYDFFQVHELKGLDDKETFAMLRRLAGKPDKAQINRFLTDHPGRIRALGFLTGGNPRSIALLFKILNAGQGDDVRQVLEQLLDFYTPLYKTRLDALPKQAQQLVDAMAIHWDPLTAADLMELTRPTSVNQVSAQLKRLEDLGVVEKTPWFGEKKTGFQIAERSFNIWYLMRAGQKARRRLLWLATFLEARFDHERGTGRPRRSALLPKRWDDAVRELKKVIAGEFVSTGPFREIVGGGHVADAITILEQTGADERWRPVYEALRAANAGSPDYLNRVAPEVRTVALEILREIAPRLFPGKAGG